MLSKFAPLRTIIGDDFDTVILPDTHATVRVLEQWCTLMMYRHLRVGGSQVNADSTIENVFSAHGYFFEEGGKGK
jgi:hypothetical protein